MKSIKHFYSFLIVYQIQAWVWPVTVENPVSKEKAIFRENNNHTWLYVVPYFAFIIAVSQWLTAYLPLF